MMYSNKSVCPWPSSGD